MDPFYIEGAAFRRKGQVYGSTQLRSVQLMLLMALVCTVSHSAYPLTYSFPRSGPSSNMLEVEPSRMFYRPVEQGLPPYTG
jgi:hypothetical protein